MYAKAASLSSLSSMVAIKEMVISRAELVGVISGATTGKCSDLYTKSFRLGLNLNGGGADRWVDAIGGEGGKSRSLSEWDAVRE